MKKTLSIVLLLLLSVSMLFSCGRTTTTKNQLTALNDNELLYVDGRALPFVNASNKTETITNLSYTESVTYTLSRTAYSGYSNSILYDGYYYYWSTNENTVSEKIGTKTTETTTLYSYMPYAQDISVVVKAENFIKASYDYEGGWITKHADISYNLGSYFTDINDLKTKSLDLYNLINHETERKYYIDTKSNNEYISSSVNTYNGYFYIEKR